MTGRGKSSIIPFRLRVKPPPTDISLQISCTNTWNHHEIGDGIKLRRHRGVFRHVALVLSGAFPHCVRQGATRNPLYVNLFGLQISLVAADGTAGSYGWAER